MTSPRYGGVGIKICYIFFPYHICDGFLLFSFFHSDWLANKGRAMLWFSPTCGHNEWIQFHTEISTICFSSDIIFFMVINWQTKISHSKTLSLYTNISVLTRRPRSHSHMLFWPEHPWHILWHSQSVTFCLVFECLYCKTPYFISVEYYITIVCNSQQMCMIL